jgi:iron complex outermembrane receptor protein
MDFRKYILIFFLGLLSLASSAQSDTVNLAEVKISSLANETVFKGTTQFIQVIPSKTLSEAPVTNFEDILQQLAGFDLRKRGVFGMQADLSIRGGTYDQNLIMINGIPVNDPQTGHNNLDLALTPGDISKIEIVQGPSGRWFGPNAFSGAINIITKKPVGNSMDLNISGGQYGLFSAFLAGNYRTGKIQNHTSAMMRSSSGYRWDTDFKNYGFYHQSAYNHKSTSAALQLAYQDRAYGAYGFYAAQYPDQFEHTRSFFSSLNLNTGKKVRFHGQLSWKRLFDRFELFRQGRGWFEKQGNWYVMGADSAGFRTPYGFFPYTGPNFHRTDVLNGDIGLHFDSKLGKSSAAFSVANQHILSNVLGLPLSDTIHSSVMQGGFYDHAANRTNFNLNLNQYYSKNNFSLSLGTGIYYNKQYGTLWSPGLDLGYFINENLKSFVSVNQAIRIPTFTDLYYDSPGYTPNPNLKPEKVLGLEAGIKYIRKNIVTTVSVFDRMGRDLIDWVKADPQANWESRNLTKLNTYGLALSAVYYNDHPQQKFIQSIRINYTYLQSNKSSTGYISAYALDYLHHDFTLFVQHKILKKLSAGWTFSVEKRNGGYLDYASSTVVPYATVFLLNGKIIYALKNASIYIQGNNLLNRPYHEMGSVLLPGIWIFGGFQYHLPIK